MPEPSGIGSEDLEPKIVAFVMGYFAQHPRAMDTASGIAEWWLPQNSIPDLHTMEKVLESLADAGKLERVVSDKVHYRLKSS